MNMALNTHVHTLSTSQCLSSIYGAKKHMQTPTLAYLSDLGVGATTVSRCGMHPSSAFSQLHLQVGVCAAGTLLPQGALLILDAPATLKPGVSFQTHPAAVPQRPALVQVGWLKDRKRSKKKEKKRKQNQI